MAFPIIAAAAVVGAGAAVIGTISASAARKRQAEAETGRADLAAAVSRRGQVREARIRRGRLANQAIAGGAGTTSSFITGTSALETELGQNLSFLDADLGFQRTSIREGARAASAGAIASLGLTAVQLALPRLG